MSDWLIISLLSLAPISELRGSLPFALARGISWPLAYLWCVGLNIVVAPLAFVFLSTVHKRLYHWGFYARLFDRLVKRARSKLENKVERWGFWGVALFVAIPLPVTGAWTGTLGAWILGLGWKRTLSAVAAGLMVAGLIVSVVVLAGIHVLDLFINHV